MQNQTFTDGYMIAKFIKESEKKTPVKLYVKGDLKDIDLSNVQYFGDDHSGVIFGPLHVIHHILEKNQSNIIDYVLEVDRRNSAIPLIDYTKINARIEPGAYIREHVTIGDRAVIMMGAVINIGAIIGEDTMIDMNAVIGARGTIGRRCHIGAGAVVAGVLEPPSKTPVIIEDDVLIGANAVILEGVHIGKGAVVAAGAVVTSDVLEHSVVAGSPAKVIKMKDEQTKKKTEILDDLRK